MTFGSASPVPKTCSQCPREFLPRSTLHDVCSQRCAMKKLKAGAKAKKEALRARKEAMLRIPDLIALADKDFAAYIRLRDRLAGHACISSGKPLDWSGNRVDAGHYRSRGAASHLRYNEDNCHAQTKYENRHRAGNAVEYRIRLIDRIGAERVEALEADNTTRKWTRENLIEIRATYKAKRRQLEEQTA